MAQNMFAMKTATESHLVRLLWVWNVGTSGEAHQE
jgi:hypothetical protein